MTNMKFYDTQAEFNSIRSKINNLTGVNPDDHVTVFYHMFSQRILEQHLELQKKNANLAHVWVEPIRRDKKTGQEYLIAHVIFGLES